MILAAGLGTRLRPLTDSIPKPMIDVAGHPMIAYPLAVVRESGIREVIINLHHLGDQIRSALGDGSRYGLSITYSEEDPILDTGGAIKKAEAFLSGDTFVVLNGDMVIDLDLGSVIDWHRARGATATMVLRPDHSGRGYGVIETDSTGRIRRFLGQPAEVSGELSPGELSPRELSPRELSPMMFTGVHIFEPRVFSYMREGRFGINRETYPAMMSNGDPLFGYRFSGFWSVLDTPELLEAGRRAIAAGGVLAPGRMPGNHP
jgi:NDP-sugar pyrophosphorylase family protein